MKNLEEIKKYNNSILCEGSKDIFFKESGTYYLIINLTKDANINLNIENNVNINLYEFMIFTGNVNLNYTLTLKENSKLDIISSIASNNGKVNINAHTIIEENAYCNNMKLLTLASEVNYYSNNILKGKKAKNEDYQLIINGSKTNQVYDFIVNHQSLETISNMRNFAICKDKSTIKINTDGIINNGMKESNINQKTKGILLSQDSEIEANPILEIDEFDCLASHGAGIGAIDEEDLFYLMSRGLTRLEAETLIIEGFMNPIYAKVTDERIKEYINALVSSNL